MNNKMQVLVQNWVSRLGTIFLVVAVVVAIVCLLAIAGVASECCKEVSDCGHPDFHRCVFEAPNPVRRLEEKARALRRNSKRGFESAAQTRRVKSEKAAKTAPAPAPNCGTCEYFKPAKSSKNCPLEPE